MILKDFCRFYFEVYLEDEEDTFEYVVMPEKYVHFDERRQAFIIESYMGSDFFAGEYYTGLFRGIANTANWTEDDAIPLDCIFEVLVNLDKVYVPIAEDNIALCEEEGKYWYGTKNIQLP